MDLLGSIIEPSPQEQHPKIEHFANHFWGEKNQGFDILYHNMKHGQISVKDLQEFIKENASVEELYAKHMTKLAKQATNCSTLGTFSPLMDVLRVMTEKLSSCHMDIVLKMQDIVKELSKYLEEQKSKHKQMKDLISGTAEALHNLQVATSAVLKSKEKYNQQCIEAERLRRASAPAKDIEKASNKSGKAADDYRTCVGKHGMVRENFEQKMINSAQEFQKIEDEHLHQLKGFLDTYILSFENANVLISQVHQEFRRQVNENTIDRLIQHYADTKGTGTERPEPMVFEECDPAAILATLENGTQHNHNVSSDGSQASVTTTKSKKETSGGIFGLRRRKPKQKLDTTNNSVGSKDSKDAESIESPESHSDLKVDEEGYTIRPEPSECSDKASFGFSSGSDSDSDSDDPMTRKIQVRIKPKEAVNTDSGGSDLETLNAVTKNLTLGSPSPLGIKKPVPSASVSASKPALVKQSTSDKMSTEELLRLFNSDGSSTSSPSATSEKNRSQSVTTRSSSNDLFTSTAPAKTRSESTTGKKGPAPPPPIITPTSSNHSFDDFFSASDSDIPPPRPPKPGGPAPPLVPVSTNAARPNELTINSTENTVTKKDTPSFSAPLASSESWSSLSSAGGVGTPTQSAVESFQANFSSLSRGPSPLTLTHNDTIPIAVAFTETVNAIFKGNDPSRSLTKVTGEVLVSFPAGIARAFTSNPNPAILAFRIKCPDEKTISNISHNTGLLRREESNGNTALYTFSFDMPALVAHVKQMTEKEPESPHYNIRIISYQVSSSPQTMPLHLVSAWKCEPDLTEINISYKYNRASTSGPLRNLSIIVPIQGTVSNVESSTPPSAWDSANSRLRWPLPGVVLPASGSGALHSRLKMTSGPSAPSTLAVQFLCEGSNLSGCDFELTGTGYRTSLIKKRFISGKYLSGS